MNHPLPIRMIATDVDGTLLNSSGIMPEDNIAAIRKAQEMGIVVAIASGRFIENAYLLLQEYHLSCPIIGVNGGKIVDENRNVISSRFMDQDTAVQVYQILKAAECEFFIFGRDALCTVSAKRVHHSELSQGEKVRKLGYGYTRGWDAAEECIQNPVHKFYVCDNGFLKDLRERLSVIPNTLLTQSGEYNIEVMPLGVDKGYGISEYARILDIPVSQVMAIGDQENDIPMLQAAGYGVAMGNASAETKAAARYITETNDRCGFARAIEALAFV